MTTSLRGPRTAKRLGATMLVLGLWALLGWAVWWLVWPGPAPQVTLEGPGRTAILPADHPLRIHGRVARAEGLRCNGRAVTLGGDGRFAAVIPGPTRAGMYVIRCEAEGRRGRRYPVAHARLAGSAVPLDAPIEDAVVLVLPLSKLRQGHIGWWAPLARLVARLGPALIEAGRRSQVCLRGFCLGPLHLGGVTLLGLRADGQNQLQLTLGLQDVSVGIGLPKGLAPLGLPDALRRAVAPLTGTHRLPLGSGVPLTVTLRWPPGGAPEIALGRLSSRHLDQALRYGGLVRAAAQLLGRLSQQLQRELLGLLSGARQVTGSLAAVRRTLQTGLDRLTGLLPALPAVVSPQRPAVCLGLELSHVSTDARHDQVFVHLRARVRGYTTGGRSCATPGARHAIPRGGAPFRRVVMGPPRLPRAAPGPQVLIAHDLVNAYLAALWVAGTLEHVPVRLPALKEHGFDIRSLRYGLPPFLSTTPDGAWRFEVPELGVELDTTGEPRRLFAAHLRLRLRSALTRRGALRLRVDRHRPPRVTIRCDREAGRPCVAQSRRFQSLVDIGTELALRPELATPPLQLELLLPVLDAGVARIRLTGVTPVPRGVRVSLQVR